MRRFKGYAMTGVGALVLALAVTTVAPPADAGFARGQFREFVADRTGQKDIVERLEQRGDFTTLLSLLDANGLTGALEAPGSLTLFAPNDAAFDKLDAATLAFLGDNPDVLVQILLYHVGTEGKRSFDLLRDTTTATLQGSDVLVTRENRRIFVNEAEIVRANIKASNGYVHEIDTVLSLPDDELVVENMIDVLELDGRFGLLLTALDVAGLTAVFEAADADLTLFAPTDDAFLALGQETLDAVLGDIGLLTAILTYHVVPERASALDLLIAGGAATLQGESVEAQIRRGGLKINGNDVVAPNVSAPNGIVHFIDGVLLPPSD